MHKLEYMYLLLFSDKSIGDTHIYFKELAHVIVGIGRSEMHWTDHRLEIQAGFPYCGRENSFFLMRPQSLLLRPSTGWIKPTCIMEDNPPYSETNDLNFSHIYKIPS